MCVFCDPTNIEELSLMRSEHGIVICNKFPITDRGHFLVISKKHYANLQEIPADVRQDLFSLMNSFLLEIKEEIEHTGVNLLINEGEIAGQTVEHFHIHLIFRGVGDGIENISKGGDDRGAIEKATVYYFRGVLGER